jgi:general secretion pathway protein F
VGNRYNYKAVDAAGFSHDGVQIAGSELEVLSVLSARGLLPVRVVQEREGHGAKTAFVSASKQVDAIALVRELATLLSSGVGLAESLATLLAATSHPATRAVLDDLLGNVHRGEEFSAALVRAPLDLPGYVHALTRAGEATGDLGGALQHCAEQLEFDQQMKAQAREALIYPSILIFTGIGAVLFIFSFVVPRFAGLLKGRSVDLPWLSIWVLNTGVFVHENLVAIIVGMVGAIFLMIAAMRSGEVRQLGLQFGANLPLLGRWIAGVETARWTATLAVLVKNRVPILKAIELAADSVRLHRVKSSLVRVGDEVRRGKRLSDSVEHSRLLEGTPLTMLKVGEHSGELAGMLGQVARHASDNQRSLQRSMVALIEPLSIILIGALLALIMVGVVMAMTSLTEIKL